MEYCGWLGTITVDLGQAGTSVDIEMDQEWYFDVDEGWIVEQAEELIDWDEKLNEMLDDMDEQDLLELVAKRLDLVKKEESEDLPF